MRMCETGTRLTTNTLNDPSLAMTKPNVYNAWLRASLTGSYKKWQQFELFGHVLLRPSFRTSVSCLGERPWLDVSLCARETLEGGSKDRWNDRGKVAVMLSSRASLWSVHEDCLPPTILLLSRLPVPNAQIWKSLNPTLDLLMLS